MTVAWDYRLPDPELRTVVEEGARPTLITKDKLGSIDQREIFDASLNIMNFSVILNDVQFGLFEYWYNELLGQGTAWVFDMPLVRGEGRELVQGRFVDAYSASYTFHKGWSVSASMLVDESRLSMSPLPPIPIGTLYNGIEPITYGDSNYITYGGG